MLPGGWYFVRLFRASSSHRFDSTVVTGKPEIIPCLTVLEGIDGLFRCRAELFQIGGRFQVLQ